MKQDILKQLTEENFDISKIRQLRINEYELIRLVELIQTRLKIEKENLILQFEINDLKTNAPCKPQQSCN